MAAGSWDSPSGYGATDILSGCLFLRPPGLVCRSAGPASRQSVIPLCKAELGAGEDRRALAESELHAVIQAAPNSDHAYEVHSVLSHFYLRIGRFHDADAQISAMLAAKPSASGLANVSSLFALLASHPDMIVAGDHTASIRTRMTEGNVSAPVSVNGSARSYMLDTGVDISLMTETEAAHLRLKPESSTTRMNDISGVAGSELRLVVVDDVVVEAAR